ncbi:YktB family protein [Bacillus sp. Marseille-P3661]|uniref:YktB family protein n=1 Tax=Bacillus sp. Marseille-P3661 TaxID=1936234 RepID=UPI000C81DB11|nr:DUF1054 domain-containing protein [Bacillus sp. Marseille-P3661]
MEFTGFEKQDFDLFVIPGLEERMVKLKDQLRPKFDVLASILTDDLSILTGDPMFAHVAKHARRKTNPPDDSWVAFSSNQRGYKMLPHFQITLWSTHLLIQWGIIYEAKNKEIFAQNMIDNIGGIRNVIPDHFYWNKDHMKPYGEQQSKLSDQDLINIADRLRNNKNGEIMVGHILDREDAINMDPTEFINLTKSTWEKLNILHKMAF